ncbi:MAG: hypothetical protein JO353_07170 [Phycisphaerae bacterium]|nr:hypothetical protein [Phycisphaerae bacterium]
MAVDVEPAVFWDASDEDFAHRLATWMESVKFVEGDEVGQHGRISRRSPSTNGTSGRKVILNYLRPLNIEAKDTCFTDIYPIYQIKFGRSGKREQGDAIRDYYDPIAEVMGRKVCTVRTRLPADKLPVNAAATFTDRIVSDIVESSAPLIITLGEEVWKTFLLIPQLHVITPVSRFDELRSTGYGVPGTITVAGRTLPWLHLVHPGLLGYQTHWQEVHNRWMNSEPRISS